MNTVQQSKNQKTRVEKESSKEIILSVKNVHKIFKLGENVVEIIKGVNFNIFKNEFIILFGPSGCGKSTVLNILLGLEQPTEGSVVFLGQDLYQKNDDDRAQMRKEEIGMVYQQANWIRSINVLDNVSFPLTLKGISVEERRQKAIEILQQVDMGHAVNQIASELSSGQQQRVSLARALVSNPSLIIADEPTGNLDSKSSTEIMDLFKEWHLRGKTIILVTHDLEYLKYATRSLRMADGLIVDEYLANDSKLTNFMISKRGAQPRSITSRKSRNE